MIKLMALLGLAMLGAACTTVRTYDRNGDLTGTCRITGVFRGGGQCLGYANDAGVPRREARSAKPAKKSDQPADIYDFGRGE